MNESRKGLSNRKPAPPSRSLLRFSKVFVFVLATVTTVALAEGLVRIFGNVRNVGPSFTEYDPLYGKQLKKNYSCTRITPEFTMRFTTNSLGFRGGESIDVPSGGIVFIGDSFTLGYGVSDGEEYPSIVFQALNQDMGPDQISVVNMGLGDNGNGRWIKYLQNRVKAFGPKLIVLQLCGNDFPNNIKERLFELDHKGSLVELPVPPMPLGRKLQTIIEAIPGLPYSNLVCLLKQSAGLIVDASSSSAGDREVTGQGSIEPPPRSDELTYALVENAISICRSEGWAVLFLEVAVEEQHRRQRLAAILSRYGIESRFVPAKRDRPDLYYEIDGHWNSEGHRFAADVILSHAMKRREIFEE